MKHYRKKLLSLFCAAAFTLSIAINSGAVVTPFWEGPLQTNNSDAIVSPLSDNIVWRFKDVNGKLYKRLYNCSTAEWIGDWILVG